MDSSKITQRLVTLPVVGRAVQSARDSYQHRRFPGSGGYWEQRYVGGGNSGSGSYGRLAVAKADLLNRLVVDLEIQSVLELGCGDGNQLGLTDYPKYVGVDVAPAAVAACEQLFATDPSKEFLVAGDRELPTCELGLSLDVIYHLVEDDVFERYMDDLLGHASRFVVLYTSDSDVFIPPGPVAPHVKHRPVGRWMGSRPEWRLKERVANPHPFEEGDEDSSFADFYLYEKVAAPAGH